MKQTFVAGLLLILVAGILRAGAGPKPNVRQESMSADPRLLGGAVAMGPHVNSTPVATGSERVAKSGDWNFAVTLENNTSLRIVGVKRPWIPSSEEYEKWKQWYFAKWDSLFKGAMIKVVCDDVYVDGENRQAAWAVYTDDKENSVNLRAVREGFGVAETDAPCLTEEQKTALLAAQEEAKAAKKGCWKYRVKIPKEKKKK